SAEAFILKSAYPNPFNPTTTLPLTLNKEATVKIYLYNQLGQRVQIINDSKQSIGNYHFTIGHSQLSSGIYFLRISVDETLSVQKIVLVK
ncbi:MAG: T9SS type A sorting domain-containing protein, partial [Candidatus Marinimicrobia bacterium]|nr:T9SS type A sorting domain-containing protein [Candidatus Neomarinimicrobiota bacterium]